MEPQTARKMEKVIQNAQPQPRLRALPLVEQHQEAGIWMVCGKDGMPVKEAVHAEIESVLIARGKADPGLGCALARADKQGLNHFNKAGGKHEAGDAVIESAMNVLANTMEIAYSAARSSPYLVRDNRFSDETLQVTAGDIEMLAGIGTEGFFAAYEKARAIENANLPNRRYFGRKLVLDKRNGGPEIEKVPLTLAQYAGALRDPGLVTACHLSAPQIIHLGSASPGFIKHAIEQIEKEELRTVSSMLPPAFHPEIKGSAPGSPFEYANEASGRLPDNTVAIEIKFRHRDQITRFAPLRAMHITLKGISEIYREGCGLRYINTYYGKQVADRLLSAVAHAMKEIDSELEPVGKTDSNLIYVVGNSNAGDVEKRAIIALYAKIKEFGLDGLEMEPVPTAIDAGRAHVNDLRPALALKSLGRPMADLEALTYTDMLVSAASIMDPEVVNEANSRLGNGPKALGEFVLCMIRAQIGREAGIRDTEDIVWSLRMHREGREKEDSLFRYAIEMGKQFRNNLIDIIAGL